MKKVIIFLADGFEEIEALASVDLLRRAGIDVTTASIMGRLEVTAAHNVVVKADVLAEDADYAAADMIVLPGGGVGTQNLAKSELVREQCLAFAKDRLVSAICAAPRFWRDSDFSKAETRPVIRVLKAACMERS